jgi:N-glycosylase/DNA lyase
MEGLDVEFSVAGEGGVLAESLRCLKGLRLLRQEPFECAVSYMFAQGLSVSVISQAVAKFCRAFGRELEDGHHAFPEPSDLVHVPVDGLRPYVNNYRARGERIQGLAALVDSGSLRLDALAAAPFGEARAALMALDGIGPKIADCILLFSLDHLSAFPVDRWVLRALGRHYPTVRRRLGGRKGDRREAPTARQYAHLVAFARRKFGERCGLASEYLFLFLRMMEERTLRERLEPFTAGLDVSWINGRGTARRALRKVS